MCAAFEVRFVDSLTELSTLLTENRHLFERMIIGICSPFFNLSPALCGHLIKGFFEERRISQRIALYTFSESHS